MDRKVIGESKTGLAVRIQQSHGAMSIAGQPDPLLLYVVVGASVVVGIIGSIASSPREGIVSFAMFALLFSPLICVLIFHSMRVKTLCVLDKDEGLLHIDEHSYMRGVQEVYPLEEVVCVTVRRLPSAPLAGGAATYGLFLGLRDADYLVSSSTNEATVGQDAWRISRFLGVPIETPAARASEGGVNQARLLVTTAFLYLMPILLATLMLIFIFERVPGIEPSLAGLLGAVVISQIAAMIAFAYYRTRRPYES